jgi:putative addiction module killer protein
MRYIVKRTDAFADWLADLRDRQAVAAIAKPIVRASNGNLGDVKSVGGGVSEMRIFVGKGYRLYFTIRHCEMIFLLNGGDKSSQSRDIKYARTLAAGLED